MAKAVNLPNALPGDMLFFAGNQWCPSGFIALVTCSFWQMLTRQWISHVELVFRYGDQLAVVGSSTLNPRPCLITGKSIAGVQVHTLQETIEDYDGSIWLCRLVPTQRLSEQETLLLESLVLGKVGTPYDSLGAMISGTRVIKQLPCFYEDVSHAYCSELSGWLLKHINRWSWESASMFTPSGMARDAVWTGRYMRLEKIK